MTGRIDALRLVTGAAEAAEHARELDARGVHRAIWCADRGADPGPIARFAAERGDGLLARIGAVDPPAALRRAAEAGAVGCYLDPEADCFRVTEPAVVALFDAAAQTGLPVVIAAGAPNVSGALQIQAVARRHPQLPVIMTNGGNMNISGLGLSEAYTALAASANLSILTTGVYRQDFLETVLARHGAGRVLFATHRREYSVDYELARVLGARCAPEQRADVLGGTAARLFFGAATVPPAT